MLIVGVLWWGSFGYGMYLAQMMGSGDRRLLRHGVRGTASIISAKATNTYIGGAPDLGYAGNRVHRYQVRVTLPGHQPYETYVSIAAPGLEKGDVVTVAAGRHNRKRVTIDLGQGADRKARPRVTPQNRRSGLPEQDGHSGHHEPQSHGRDAGATSSNFEQNNRQYQQQRRNRQPQDRRPDVQDAIPQQQPRRHDAANDDSERIRQLSELGRLHQEGVLTDEEFAAEKARILHRDGS